MNENTSFDTFLSHLGIEKLNEMQKNAIETFAISENVILISPTGSGKTLAFLLSILPNIDEKSKTTQVLIVTPSRELSLQIEQVFKSLKTSISATCCYGGHDAKTEINNLSQNPAIIIGTPGRIADHITRKSFSTENISYVVLDEFDKSLQFGFHAQLETIFKSLYKTKKHFLTSATNLQILPSFLPFRNVDTIDFSEPQKNKNLELKLIKTKSIEKTATLLKLIASFGKEQSLVFCNHREAVDRISEHFLSNEFEHSVFHGGMEQKEREKNLIKFRNAACNVMIATDLAARGLDIPEIKHVVHYQMPPQEDAYIHRNGRTARMHAEGLAYLILADDEQLPVYVKKDIKSFDVSEEKQTLLSPKFVNIYISAGKKEKINKGDIVGFLTQKGKISGENIGLITTLDHSSYVAVERDLVDKMLENLKNEKIKKIKVKIEVAS